jgi:hypothetical protein
VCRDAVIAQDASLLEKLNWAWTVRAQPIMLKGAAGAAAALSAIIVWCNVTVGISSYLSPLYLFIKGTQEEIFSQVRGAAVLAGIVQAGIMPAGIVPAGSLRGRVSLRCMLTAACPAN